MTITTVNIPAATDVQLLMRVTDSTGTPIVAADVSQPVAVAILNPDTGHTTSYDIVDVSAVILDTLQTDSRWTVDAKGYNVAITVPAADLTGGTIYRVTVIITPTVGTAFAQTFVLRQVS